MSIITPPPYGRPDYSAPSPNMRQLVAHVDQEIPSNYATPLMSTAQWAGVEVLWIPTGYSSFLEVAWYDDANEDNLLGTAPLYSTEGNQVIGPVTFEHVGPYFYVQLQHYPTTGANSNDQAWIYQVAAPFRLSTPFMGDYATDSDNFNIAANSTYTYTSYSMQSGPARLWISSTEAVTWELQRASGYGTYIQVDGSLAAGTVFRDTVILPVSEWQMTITNTTASAATVYLYIQPSITGAL